MCCGLIFNNICTGVHVIDAIEGVYVSDANAQKAIMNQVVRQTTLQKPYRSRPKYR